MIHGSLRLLKMITWNCLVIALQPNATADSTSLGEPGKGSRVDPGRQAASRVSRQGAPRPSCSARCGGVSPVWRGRHMSRGRSVSGASNLSWCVSKSTDAHYHLACRPVIKPIQARRQLSYIATSLQGKGLCKPLGGDAGAEAWAPGAAEGFVASRPAMHR